MTTAIASPELALVDPTLRAQVPSAPRLADPTIRGALEDDEVRAAMRRLGALAELEPPSRPRRSTTLLSVAFAASAWATLALLLADLQPWRV